MAYPIELRRAALTKLIRNPHRSFHSVAREYEISGATLHRWYTEARKNRASLRPSDAAPEETQTAEPDTQ